MKTWQVLLVLIILCFGFNSCKLDEDEQKVLFPREYLDYFQFKIGSYWIYENDKTKQIDTLTVTQFHRTLPRADDNIRYEVTYNILESTMEGYSYKFSTSMYIVSGLLNANPNRPNYQLACAKFREGSQYVYAGNTKMLVYPFQVGFTTNVGEAVDSSSIAVEKVLNKLTINNITFANVVVFLIKNYKFDNKHDTRLYWAKDIGIVKRENLVKNESWNIVKYNALKYYE